MTEAPGLHRVHAAALVGFGENAADYERARPGYPAEAVAFLAERLGLGPGRTVLDVGAGTGKLTGLLGQTGAAVVAVEPVASMRAQLRRSVPWAPLCAATAEELPLRSGSVDAIVSAQAFHWFATEEVLEEFARVLRPDGALALLWNLRDNSVPWVHAFTELLRPYEGNRPDHNRGEWRSAFRSDGPFGALETTSFGHEQAMTPELLVGRAASMSFVGAMESVARTALLDTVRMLGQAQGTAFSLPYRTDVHLATRRDRF